VSDELDTFVDACITDAEACARRFRRDGYTVDAARHHAVYGLLGALLGAEDGLRAVDRLQRAAELEPDPSPPAGVFTGHGQWVTHELVDEEGATVHVAVCNCGWRTEARKSAHSARALLQLHVAEAVAA
jgi:hypothetical protein